LRLNAKRKENSMQAVGMLPKTYNRVIVHVPVGNVTTRFKRIVRAMGFEIEKKNAIDEALEDIEAGRVVEVSSVAELRKHFA